MANIFDEARKRAQGNPDTKTNITQAFKAAKARAVEKETVTKAAEAKASAAAASKSNNIFTGNFASDFAENRSATTNAMTKTPSLNLPWEIDSAQKTKGEEVKKQRIAADRSAYHDAMRDSSYNRVKQQQISDLESQIKTSRDKESQNYIKMTTAPDAQTKAIYGEQYYNAKNKTAKLEDMLQKQGGKTASDKVKDYIDVVDAVLMDEGKLAELSDSIDIKLSNLSNRVLGTNFDTSKQQEEIQNIQNIRAAVVDSAKQGHNELGKIALGGTEAASKMLGDVALWHATGGPTAMSYAAAPVEAYGLSEAALGASGVEKFATLAKRFGANAAADIMKGGGVNFAISANSGLNTYVNAIMNGASDEDASKAGFMVAAGEYFSNKLFSGTPLEDSAEEKGAVTELVELAVKKLGKSKVLANALDTVPGKIFSKMLDVIGEGAEEVITGVADPLIAQRYYDPTQRVSREQLADDFATGVAMSIILGVPGTVKDVTGYTDAMNSPVVPYTQQTNVQTPAQQTTLTKEAGIPFTSEANNNLQQSAANDIINQNEMEVTTNARQNVTETPVETIAQNGLVSVSDFNARRNQMDETGTGIKNGTGEQGTPSILSESQQTGYRPSISDNNQSSDGRRISQKKAERLRGTSVIDSSGNPIAVYHGTLEKFSKWLIGDIGFHFGTIAQAKNRVATGANLSKKLPRAYRVFLNIKNPLIVETDLCDWRAAFKIVKYLETNDIINSEEANLIYSSDINSYFEEKVSERRDFGSAIMSKIRNVLREKGYDGIKYLNEFETPDEVSNSEDRYSYIVFSNSQIVRDGLEDISDIFDHQIQAWEERLNDPDDEDWMDFEGNEDYDYYSNSSQLDDYYTYVENEIDSLKRKKIAIQNEVRDSIYNNEESEYEESDYTDEEESRILQLNNYIKHIETLIEDITQVDRNYSYDKKIELQSEISMLKSEIKEIEDRVAERKKQKKIYLKQQQRSNNSSSAKTESNVRLTTQEQSRLNEIDAELEEQNNQLRALDNTTQAQNDAGKIGTAADILKIRNETVKRIEQLTQEKDSILENARQRESVPADERVARLQQRYDTLNEYLQTLDPESDAADAIRQKMNQLQKDLNDLLRGPNAAPATESDALIQLRAKLVNLEDALAAETNPTERSRIQNEIDRTNELIYEAERQKENAPAPTDDDAPKYGHMKESTSVPYGNPNGVKFESLSPDEAANMAYDYVRTLGGPDATTADKANILLNKTTWALEDELASDILYSQLIQNDETELANQLIDTHILQRSKGGQKAALGYRLQSDTFRARKSVTDLAKKVRDVLQNKLDKAKSDSRKTKLKNQLDALDNEFIPTAVDFINRADKIFNSKKKESENVVKASMILLLGEISDARGRRFSKTTMDCLTKLNLWQLYDISLSASIGLVCDAMPLGFFEGANTIQSIAQLLNIPTLERNIINNAVFAPLENTIIQNAAAVADMILAPFAKKQSKGKGIAKDYRTTAVSKSLFGKGARNTAVESGAESIARINLDAPNGQLGKYENRKYQVFGKNEKVNSGFVRSVNSFLGEVEQILAYGMSTTDAFQGGQREGAVRQSLNSLVNDEHNRVDENIAKKMSKRSSDYSNWHRKTELGSLLSAAGGLLNKSKFTGFGKQANRTYWFNGKEYSTHDMGLGDFIIKYGRFLGTSAQTILEYTPLGYVKAVYNLGVMKSANEAVARGEGYLVSYDENGKQSYGYEDLTNNEKAVIAQRESAESLVRPIVGTALVFLFKALTNLGILKKNDSDDKDELQDKKNFGFKGLSLNMSALNRAIKGEDPLDFKDDDWLMQVSDISPFDALASAGYALEELGDNVDDPNWMDYVFEIVASTTQQISEMNVSNTFKTIGNDWKYRDKEDDEGNPLTSRESVNSFLESYAADGLSSDITGFIPGPVKKFAAALDNVQRDTSSDTVLGEVKNNVINALPWLRETLPERLDAHGNPITNGLSDEWNAVNSMLMPYNLTRYHATDVQKKSDEVGVYPVRKAPNYYRLKDEDGVERKHELTTEEKRKWMSDYGDAFDSTVELLLSSGNMDQLSKSEQETVLRKIKTYSNAIAKNNYLESLGLDGNKLYSDARQIEKAIEVTEQGIDFADYFIVQKKHDEIEDNNTGSAYDMSAEFNNWLDHQSWISDTQENVYRKYLIFSGGYSVGADEGAYDGLKAVGVSDDDALSVYDAVAAVSKQFGTDTKEWQKDEAIVKLPISEEAKLKAVIYYADAGSDEARAKNKKYKSMQEKIQIAYDKGFDVATIVNYRKLKSDHSSKSEMRSNYRDYDLTLAEFTKLYNIFNA